MEILDYAIQMERDGYEFYTDAAARQQDPASRRMLGILAEDEKRHEEIIKGIKAGRSMMIESKNFAGIKNIFQELSESNKSFFNPDGCLTEVLEKGAAIEARSVELYRDYAAKAANPAEKEIWTKLQHEEEKHQKLLELTLEYVDTPERILENAEFLFYGHDNQAI
jgi:rubrerythrin